MPENTNIRFMIFTYYNNERHYLLKDGSLALLNKYPFSKYKSYKLKASAKRIARELTRKVGYLHQYSIISVKFL